jgi:hypothetical protein
VWSLGLTLHEIAHLRFPFPPEGENEYVAPIELLSYIVTAPVPVMIDDERNGRIWSENIKSFMSLWSVLPFLSPGRTSGLTLKSYSERHRTALSKGAPVPSLHRNERDEESQHGEMGRKRLGELELLSSLHDPRRSHNALLPTQRPPARSLMSLTQSRIYSCLCICICPLDLIQHWLAACILA